MKRNIQCRPTPLMWISGEGELQPFFFRGDQEYSLIEATLRDIVIDAGNFTEDVQSYNVSLVTCELHVTINDLGVYEENTELDISLSNATLRNIVVPLPASPFVEEQQELDITLTNATLDEVIIDGGTFTENEQTLNISLTSAILS